MANKRLSTLLTAAGLPNGAGKKLSDIPGAPHGMSNFNLYSLDNWNSNDYFQEQFYNNNDTLTWTFNASSGSEFWRIRKNVNEFLVYDNVGSDPMQVEVVSGTWDTYTNGTTGNSITVRVHGRPIPSQSAPAVGFNWYQDYSQGEPYPNNDVAIWTIALYVPTGGQPGGYNTLNLMFQYPNDAGGFNDGITYGPIPVKVLDYNAGGPSYIYEWFTGYNADPNLLTNLVNQGNSYSFDSYYPDNYQGTFYIRYKTSSGAPWQGPMTVNWHDPRWN
jgi:hypothetical protein